MAATIPAVRPNSATNVCRASGKRRATAITRLMAMLRISNFGFDRALGFRNPRAGHDRRVMNSPGVIGGETLQATSALVRLDRHGDVVDGEDQAHGYAVFGEEGLQGFGQ